MTFLSRGPDDPKHQASGTVWLKHQHDRVCGDTMFQLQVGLTRWPLRVTVIAWFLFFDSFQLLVQHVHTSFFDLNFWEACLMG